MKNKMKISIERFGISVKNKSLHWINYVGDIHSCNYNNHYTWYTEVNSVIYQQFICHKLIYKECLDAFYPLALPHLCLCVRLKR